MLLLCCGRLGALHGGGGEAGEDRCVLGQGIGVAVTVDVTPRRIQHFDVQAGDMLAARIGAESRRRFTRA